MMDTVIAALVLPGGSPPVRALWIALRSAPEHLFRFLVSTFSVTPVSPAEEEEEPLLSWVISASFSANLPS